MRPLVTPRRRFQKREKRHDGPPIHDWRFRDSFIRRFGQWRCRCRSHWSRSDGRIVLHCGAEDDSTLLMVVIMMMAPRGIAVMQREGGRQQQTIPLGGDPPQFMLGMGADNVASWHGRLFFCIWIIKQCFWNFSRMKEKKHGDPVTPTHPVRQTQFSVAVLSESLWWIGPNEAWKISPRLIFTPWGSQSKP